VTETNLCYGSIAELAPLIKRGTVSPVEVTRAVLERIEALNKDLVAYITVLPEQALAAARRAEREIRRGGYRGSLHGIPVSLKDIFATKGIRTTNGSRSTADWVPDHDATVTERLAAAGAILVGKNTLYEFATGPPAEAPLGMARNPWDRERLTGGSSTGSGGALAAGLCHGSIGSDTGGSIRIPAAMCGVVGLKPTYGRVSRHGVTTLSWSLDHAGPMARTVRDVALLLQEIAGHDPKDPGSSSARVPSYTRDLGKGLRGLRVGILGGHFQENIDPEVQAAVEAAVGVLRKLGARPVEAEIPHAGHALSIYMAIMPPEAIAYHAPALREKAALYGPGLRARIRPGHFILATQYLNAQRARGLLLDEARAALSKADVLLAPTSPIPAKRFDQETLQWPGGTESTRMAMARLTRPFNVTGLPTISVPCGFTGGGLPIGLQIVGRAFDEATVLRVVHAYQQATDWHKRRPPL
jgi:aspartyl-tRNA(Asn)/glutamyl-tRNA(Gln) amidotransferase subunit A